MRERAVGRGWLPLACAALASGAFAAAAGAEIYRCPGPGGRPVFTSDAAACSGSVRHRPSRDVQRVEGGGKAEGDPASPVAPPAAAAGVGDAGAAADAQQAMWSRKRRESEAELAQLESRVEEMGELVSWCNRGGELVVEDSVGVRDRYSCDEARTSFDAMKRRISELESYLDGGLEEECRRSGCLPGWIR